MAQVADVRDYQTLIEAALAYEQGAHTFEDVCQRVDAGEMQLWPGKSSCVVTELYEYPQYKTLHFFLAAGNLAELEVMTPIILEWGKSKGCSRASLVGRAGWERTFLTRTGWHKCELVMMEKTL